MRNLNEFARDLVEETARPKAPEPAPRCHCDARPLAREEAFSAGPGPEYHARGRCYPSGVPSATRPTA